jgi:regulatory protein
VARKRGIGGPRPGTSCADKALDLLALRPHFEAELRFKLEGRDYEAAQVEEVLARLRERGLLDDRRLAAEFVERQRQERPVGRRRLLAELARRGVDATLAEEAVAEISEEDDEVAAREAAARWARRRGGERAALARHLERLGFGARAILSVLDEAAEGSGVAPDDHRAVLTDPPADS